MPHQPGSFDWAVGGQTLPCFRSAAVHRRQVAGAIAASGVLYVIASGREGFSTAAGFASNGYGPHSPGGYSLLACLITEVVLTMFFLLIILGCTDERAPKGFAAIPIGLGLSLIQLIPIPVTNTSVNPARAAPVRRCLWEDGRWGSCGCSGLPRLSGPRSQVLSITRCSRRNEVLNSSFCPWGSCPFRCSSFNNYPARPKTMHITAARAIAPGRYLSRPFQLSLKARSLRLPGSQPKRPGE